MATLTYDKFRRDSEELVRKCSSSEQKFRTEESDQRIFLKFEQTLVDEVDDDECDEHEFNIENNINSETKMEEEDENITSDLQDTDENSTNSRPSRLITAEYQVHYCESYEVPLLLARYYSSSGNLLLVDHIYKLLKMNAANIGIDDISISPHPVDDSPWLKVHPCRTSEIMSTILPKSDDRINFVAAFISFYGQALGFNLDPKMAVL